jgi:hypothetical protein
VGDGSVDVWAKPSYECCLDPREKSEDRMPSFGDFIVYVDESGDHSLVSVNPEYPIFVLAFCLFEKEAYAEKITTEITNLKFKYFGHDQVILHERDIRKEQEDFSILRDRETRSAFMKDVSRIVRNAPLKIIASIIDKRRLKDQYEDPANPYHLALAFGLERLYLHLHEGMGCNAGKLHLVFERRGTKEDNDLELEFRRVIDEENNALRQHLPFNIVFSSKKSNSAGLQLADLVARPIGRHQLNPEQSNRAFDVIKDKIRSDPTGDVEGWGLKVFP